MANGSTYQFDPQLTAVVNMIPSQQLIAGQAFPRVRTEVNAFVYTEIPRGQFYALPETIIGPRGIPNEVEFRGIRRSGVTEDHALTGVVPRRSRQITMAGQQGPVKLDPRQTTATGVRQLIDLKKEVTFAGVVFNANNYATGQKPVLSGTSQWSDPDSDPARDILEAKENMFVEPNTLVLGSRVALTLTLHPKLIAAWKGQNPQAEGSIPLSWLAGFLGFERVLVGKARRTTNNPGQPDVFERIWGNHAAMFHSSTQTFDTVGGDPVIVTFAAEFFTPIDGGDGDSQYFVSEYTDPEPGPGQGVDKIKVGTSYAYQVIAPEFGYLWQNAVV